MNPSVYLSHRNGEQFRPGRKGNEIMKNREKIMTLCEQCKAENLPKNTKTSTRKHIFEAAKQARGWLNSSFFTETSTENIYHIELLTQLLTK